MDAIKAAVEDVEGYADLTALKEKADAELKLLVESMLEGITGDKHLIVKY